MSCSGISTLAWVARSRGIAPHRTHIRRSLRRFALRPPRCLLRGFPGLHTNRYLSLFFGIFAPDLRAWFSAIATACLCGLPCFASVLMLRDTAAFDVPFFSGMILSYDQRLLKK